MKKTAVLLIFCLWQVSMALQAPYLFAADSVADTAIQLTWRNNSTAYLGIIVLRKTAGAGQYSAIDTSPGGATSFTDVVRPSAQTTYYYALTAYSQTEHADTSNSDSVMITPAPGIVFLFAPLRLDAEWNAVSHIMTISFFDSSNVEAGYRILRSANFGTPQLIRDIPSVIPASTGTISFNDSSPVLPNTWYRYYGTVYRAADSSRTSQSNPVYAFDRNIMTNELIAAAPRKCVLSNKIGSFPIKYRSWSLKAGDTIVLNEKGMPADSMFSIINVSNPAVPKYAGTGASIAARFDTASMAGAFAVTRGRTIFGCFAYQLYMLEYHNGTIQVVKSLQGPGYFLCLNPSFLSDTTFVIAGSYSEMAGIAGASTEYSLARYAFGSTTISLVDTMKILPNTGVTMMTGEDYKLLGSIAWNGKYVINEYHDTWGISSSPVTDSAAEIIDFNYASMPAYSVPHVLVHPPRVVDGILITDPVLITMNDIMIDTVKNLVFALSNTELSIYSGQITGVKTSVYAGRPVMHGLTFQKSVSSSTLVLFPQHSKPADMYVYSISGKLVQHFGTIAGEAFLWDHGNLSGLYMIKATVDGRTLTARNLLVR